MKMKGDMRCGECGSKLKVEEMPVTATMQVFDDNDESKPVKIDTKKIVSTCLNCNVTGSFVY